MTDNINEKELNQEQTKEAEATAADNLDNAAQAVKAALDAGDFDIKDFLTQYKEATDAKAESEDRLVRLQADFENFRRRSRIDAKEVGSRATGELVSLILPIIDNFERALTAMSESADKEGVAMIYKQLMDVLHNTGLSEIEALGADFDPNLHHSVAQLEADPDQKGKILAVLQKGYMFGDKLLRAPLVQVGV